MSSGLDNIMKPIEMDKTDWVNYDGIMMPKMSAAGKKAWKERKKNLHYKKYKCISKENQRDILINLLLKSNQEWMQYNVERYTVYERHMIILETPELLFVKRLQEKGHGELPHNLRIWIPNNIEYSKFIHSEHCNACKGNVWGEHQLKDISVNWWDVKVILKNSSYKDFLDSWYYDDKHFSTCFIWADYCGAFSSYTEDIEKTFSKHILGNHSIYAITFCKRDPLRDKKLKQYSFTNCIVAVNDFVSKVAKKYGYAVDLLPESSMYKSNMFTAIFLVKYEMMDKCKEQIEKIIEENTKLRNELRHKLQDLDYLMEGVHDTGDQCPICGRYFKAVDIHVRQVHPEHYKTMLL